MSSDSGETDVEKLKKRIELLEFLLIELAGACWQQCGSNWINKAAKLIVEAKKD
jgi:hypothetical protein